MTSPAGWHPDPVPPQPGQPPQLRYWDGTRWTEHTAPAHPPAAYPYAAVKASTTPDGVPLASWWERVGATLVDGLILLPITGVLFLPFYGRIIDAYRDYFDEVAAASETGAPSPSPFEVQSDLLGTFLLMALIGLAFSLLWTFLWLRWKAATPGKLLLGLRIRLRETPGPLSWGTIGRRWLGQNAASVAGLVPFVGGFLGLYSLLDVLWPLWDDKRQAIHDKIARTNVVKTR